VGGAGLHVDDTTASMLELMLSMQGKMAALTLQACEDAARLEAGADTLEELQAQVRWEGQERGCNCMAHVQRTPSHCCMLRHHMPEASCQERAHNSTGNSVLPAVARTPLSCTLPVLWKLWRLQMAAGGFDNAADVLQQLALLTSSLPEHCPAAAAAAALAPLAM
jgi:hypothetical protein